MKKLISHIELEYPKSNNAVSSPFNPCKNIIHSRGSTPRISYRQSIKIESPKNFGLSHKKKQKIRSNPSSLEKENINFYKTSNKRLKPVKRGHEIPPPFQTPNNQVCCRSQYLFIYQIGFGGFGKVWKVQNRNNQRSYAMKQIQKIKVIQKDSVQCIINERKILSKLHHPFLVNMSQAFQDDQHLYLVMDYLRGADLRYHICYKEKFSEIQTKFLLACLIQAVEYVHEHQIIHRDIKPQNLILEQNGYLRLTDFGIAKYQQQIAEGTYDSSGTPGYMAPEVLFRKQYSYTADYFAIGVIGYEMMLGKRPYQGKNRKQIKQKLSNINVKIQEFELPNNWSQSSRSFINGLIEKQPSLRIGSRKGIKQLKKHAWFGDINWKKISKKEIKPNFIPYVVCQTKQYLDQINCYNQLNQDSQKHTLTTIDPKTQKLFDQYYFDRKPKVQGVRKFKKPNLRSSLKNSMIDLFNSK